MAGLGHIIRHAKVHRAFVIIPVQMDAEKNLPVPVYGASVLLGEMIDEVVGIFFMHVFDSEVIYDEAKINVAGCVFEEARSAAGVDVPPLVQVSDKFIIRYSSCLW